MGTKSQSAVMSLHFRLCFPSGMTRTTLPCMYLLPFMLNDYQPLMYYPGIFTCPQGLHLNSQPFEGNLDEFDTPVLRGSTQLSSPHLFMLSQGI